MDIFLYNLDTLIRRKIDPPLTQILNITYKFGEKKTILNTSQCMSLLRGSILGLYAPAKALNDEAKNIFEYLEINYPAVNLSGEWLQIGLDLLNSMDRDYANYANYANYAYERYYYEHTYYKKKGEKVNNTFSAVPYTACKNLLSTLPSSITVISVGSKFNDMNNLLRNYLRGEESPVINSIIGYVYVSGIFTEILIDGSVLLISNDKNSHIIVLDYRDSYNDYNDLFKSLEHKFNNINNILLYYNDEIGDQYVEQLSSLRNKNIYEIYFRERDKQTIIGRRKYVLPASINPIDYAVISPPIGMKNIGSVTCYYNVIMQVLFASPLFRLEINKLDSKIPIIRALQDFLKRKSINNKVDIAVLDIIRKEYPRFKSGEQDTQELTLSIFGSIMNGLAQYYNKKVSWNNPFDFEYTVTYYCLTCLNTHIVPEYILMMVTSPPTNILSEYYFPKHPYLNKSLFPGKKSIVDLSSIENAIYHYANIEIMEDIACLPCKKQLLGVKMVKLSRLPRTLIIHIRRFKKEGGGHVKDDRHVTFGQYLNLAPHCTPDCIGRNKNPVVKYSLYGVICHFGSLMGGHYICYVRSRRVNLVMFENCDTAEDEWYYISDSTVIPARFEDVLLSNAYMLFYDRIY